MQILPVCHLLPNGEWKSGWAKERQSSHQSQNWKEGLFTADWNLKDCYVSSFPQLKTNISDISGGFNKISARKIEFLRIIWKSTQVMIYSCLDFKCFHCCIYASWGKGYPWAGWRRRRRRRIYVNPFLGRIQGIYICHGLKPTGAAKLKHRKRSDINMPISHRQCMTWKNLRLFILTAMIICSGGKEEVFRYKFHSFK